jgi:hypothetical protein
MPVSLPASEGFRLRAHPGRNYLGSAGTPDQGLKRRPHLRHRCSNGDRSNHGRRPKLLSSYGTEKLTEQAIPASRRISGPTFRSLFGPPRAPPDP